MLEHTNANLSIRRDQFQVVGAENEGPTLVFDSGNAWTLENWNSIKNPFRNLLRWLFIT